MSSAEGSPFYDYPALSNRELADRMRVLESMMGTVPQDPRLAAIPTEKDAVSAIIDDTPETPDTDPFEPNEPLFGDEHQEATETNQRLLEVAGGLMVAAGVTTGIGYGLYKFYELLDGMSDGERSFFILNLGIGSAALYGASKLFDILKERFGLGNGLVEGASNNQERRRRMARGALAFGLLMMGVGSAEGGLRGYGDLVTDGVASAYHAIGDHSEGNSSENDDNDGHISTDTNATELYQSIGDCEAGPFVECVEDATGLHRIFHVTDSLEASGEIQCSDEITIEITPEIAQDNRLNNPWGLLVYGDSDSTTYRTAPEVANKATQEGLLDLGTVHGGNFVEVGSCIDLTAQS